MSHHGTQEKKMKKNKITIYELWAFANIPFSEKLYDSLSKELITLLINHLDSQNKFEIVDGFLKTVIRKNSKEPLKSTDEFKTFCDKVSIEFLKFYAKEILELKLAKYSQEDLLACYFLGKANPVLDPKLIKQAKNDLKSDYTEIIGSKEFRDFVEALEKNYDIGEKQEVKKFFENRSSFAERVKTLCNVSLADIDFKLVIRSVENKDKEFLNLYLHEQFKKINKDPNFNYDDFLGLKELYV